MKGIITTSLMMVFAVTVFGQNLKIGESRLSPRLMNYQGYLTDTLGNPININSLSMNLTIFDQETASNQFLVRAAGGVGNQTNSPTSQLDVSGANGYSQFRMRATYTPTGSADANGNVGDVARDGDYVYIKTAAGWKRAALASW